VLSQAGSTVSVAYKLNWLAATGTLLFVSGVITTLILGIKPLLAIKTYGRRCASSAGRS